MKNLKLYYILFVLLFTFDSISVASQTIAKRYDLNFRGINSCTKLWTSWIDNCRFTLDSTTLKSNKSALKVAYAGSKKDGKMSFSLYKTIILPVNDHQKNAAVSIISKADVSGDFWIKITSLNDNDREISSKIVRINSRVWGEKGASIKISGAKAIRINIRYNGNGKPEQNIWIDKVLIKVDGKDIGQQNYFSKKVEDSIAVYKSLNEKHIVPLTVGNDSTLLTGITDFYNKRIIGIGESAHGSRTIKAANYQFLKNLILNTNCKLVLLEYPIDMTLTWELYVQGKISAEHGNQIELDAKCLFNDYGQLIDFLKWLRFYNQKSNSKVHIFGIDNPADTKLYLFEYNLALLGKENGKVYLKMIAEKKYGELIDYAESDQVLKKNTDSQSLQFYLYFLKNEKISLRSEDEFLNNRDLNMSKRVENLMEIYLKPEEKAAVYTHSGHIEYLEPYDDYTKKNARLGFYLRKKFADQYFSISFQIGQGKYTQDECYKNGQTIVDSLENPPPYSFEYAGLRTGHKYFYFQSKYLGHAILSCASIARTSRYTNFYQFSSLKNAFDAYVFIRESKEIEKIELFPWLYAIDRFYDKREAMKAILKEL